MRRFTGWVGGRFEEEFADPIEPLDGREADLAAAAPLKVDALPDGVILLCTGDVGEMPKVGEVGPAA